ncbi:MAG: ABC transporter permease [Chitinophagaceae bacterium]|nr:ABC transporter permease [Chitinophagaceae bacterium]
MRPIIAFIKKEFHHLLRDRQTLLILLGMPIVQIIIFGFALTNEVKNSRIAVMDLSKDVYSRSLLDQVEASRYFDIEREVNSYSELESAFRKGKIRMALVIPVNFEKDLEHQHRAAIQVIADASDPNVASTLTNYASAIVRDFQSGITDNKILPLTIQTELRMMYNPQLKGAYNFVPGVMAMVLMLVCTLMTAITVVREKERGTMEILLVSPMRPYTIMLAKAIPSLVLSIVNVASILLLSVFVLDVPVNGSLPLLLMESVLFTLTCLAFGLLISASTDSQQTAMFISLTGMFLPTLMLSGFMFPIENMPFPLQMVSNIVPAKWYYQVVKNVMIKGVGLEEVWKETLILGGMMVLLMALAIKKFKIRLA